MYKITPLMLSALLTTSFISACATNEQAAIDAAKDQGVLDASRKLPPLPPECRRTERLNVQKGERLDVAVLKGDNAVGRQNARTRRCARWYDTIKKGVEKTPKS